MALATTALTARLAQPASHVRRFARTPILAPLAFVIFFIGAWVQSGHQTTFVIQLAISGIGPGAIAALSGMGLVLTYRATGVFNFSQGTIATLVAYSYWEMAAQHHVPRFIAGVLAILVIGPIIGLLVERLVFRPLDRRGASTSEKLVASLGLTVLLLGVCITIWGQQNHIAPGLLPFAGHQPIALFGKYQISTVAIG